VSDKKPHVLISVPTSNQIFVQTAGWIFETLKIAAKNDDIKVGLHFVVSPYPIEVQRNLQIQNFLGDERFTHIFFLDSDCIPKPLTIEKLLDYDKDIVASVAPALIGMKHVFTAATLIPEEKRENPDQIFFMPTVNSEEAHGLKEVDGVGMTGVLIRREVFEKIEPPYFRFEFSPDGTRLTLGEDYYFCKKAKDAGYQIWADFDLRQVHMKTVSL
jgi:GT2 family glycosyltransferase